MNTSLDNLILVFYGASGAGKSYYKGIFISHGGFNNIKSYTTRPTRKSETGEEYHFVSLKEIEYIDETEDFINLNLYGQDVYGVRLSDFVVPGPSVMISDLSSLVGLRHDAQAHGKDIKFVYVAAPNLNVLRGRHLNRGTSNRFDKALNELEAFKDTNFQSDYTITTTEEAIKLIKEIRHE